MILLWLPVWALLVWLALVLVLACCEGGERRSPPLPPDWAERAKLARRVRRAEAGLDPWAED